MAFQTVWRREEIDKELEDLAMSLGEPSSSASSDVWIWTPDPQAECSHDQESDSEESEEQWHQTTSVMSAESYFPSIYDSSSESSICGYTSSTTELKYQDNSFLSSSDEEVCLNIWTNFEDDMTEGQRNKNVQAQDCYHSKNVTKFINNPSAIPSRSPGESSSEDSFHTFSLFSEMVLPLDKCQSRVDVDSDTDGSYYTCPSSTNIEVTLGSDTYCKKTASNTDVKFIDASVQTSSLIFRKSTSPDNRLGLGQAEFPKSFTSTYYETELDKRKQNKVNEDLKEIGQSDVVKYVKQDPGLAVRGPLEGDPAAYSPVLVSILEDLVSWRGVEVVREVCTYHTTSQRLDWHDVLPPDKWLREKHSRKGRTTSVMTSIHQMTHPRQIHSQELFQQHAPSLLTLLPCGQPPLTDEEEDQEEEGDEDEGEEGHEEEGQEEAAERYWAQLPPPRSDIDMCDGRKLPLLERFIKQADDVLILEIILGGGLIAAFVWWKL